MEGIKIFLAHPSLLGLPLEWIMKVAKKTGFDGIEWMMTTKVIQEYERIIRESAQLNIETTFHQPWEEHHLLNNVLRTIRVLPKFKTVSDVLPQGFNFPLVVHSAPAPTIHIEEVKTHPSFMILEICHQFQEGETCPSLKSLIAEIKKNNLSIVFDVFYYLEYYFQGKIPQNISAEKILRILKEGWNQLQENVVEIHYYDAIPGKGLISGKNLLPGTGILPLAKFLDYVRKSGWQGRIVLELNPVQLFLPPWELKKKLRSAMEFTKEHLGI